MSELVKLKSEIAEHLWAKSEPYKPLWMHLLETGVIAQVLISEGIFYPLAKEMSENFEASLEEIAELVGYIGAVHDIGKCHVSFQIQADTMKVAKLLTDNAIAVPALGGFRHEQYGSERLNEIWKNDAVFSNMRFRSRLAEVVRFHHQGKKKGVSVETDDFWLDLQLEIEGKMRGWFKPPDIAPKHMDSACMMLTGILIVADWIASGKDFAETDWHNDWDTIEKQTRERMQVFLNKNHMHHKPVDKKIKKFTDLWWKIPQSGMRPLQKIVENIFQCEEDMPLGVIVEAPMGCGKTEAGLYAALRLAQRWGKEGFYVALPTSATSNQMYGRVNAMLDSLQDIQAKLMHGMAWLMDEEESLCNTEDSVYAKLWTAPLRRGLLAPFAVGTVDQVMMSAMRTKYGVLRLAGLAQKVLIIDELHAYDAYMSSIIEKLLKWCKVMHVPVVMLSATLPYEKKIHYAECYSYDEGALNAELYPVVTLLFADKKPQQVFVDEKSRKMNVRVRKVPLLNRPDEIADYLAQRLESLGNGCFCTLVNTVNEAQLIYDAVKSRLPDVPTILFHARFSADRRQEIEKECLHLLGKDKTKRPEKLIVIATQVVEQSLDLDFDEMISDICPIDLLLQRMGRIWRHDDTIRPLGCKEPCITVLLPEDGIYGSTEVVYPRFLLQRTMKSLEENDMICLPEDIPKLVQKVYSGQGISDEELEEWLEYNTDNELMEGQAVIQELPNPSAKKFCLSDGASKAGDLFFADEDCDFLPARTRLGERSAGIAIVPRSLYQQVNETKVVSKRLAKKVLGYSVNVPEKKILSFLTKDGVIKGNGLLLGVWVFPGDEGICRFADGTVLEMNKERGFLIG